MFKEKIVIFKAQKMKIIVEEELKLINVVLSNAKKNNLTESINNYTSQKIALENILKKFDEI